MRRKLNIAVLGVVHYHANFWTKALLASDKAEVAGVWDGDGEQAARFAAGYSVRHEPDLERLLQASDAVAICSSTADHKPLIRASAQAGKPILCEKPLARSVEEGLEIAGILAKAGVPFMQSFPKRFDPATRELLEVVRSGELGRIHMCRIRHGHGHGLQPEFRSAWFTDPEQSGGGTLLDEGVHAADLLRMLFGEPERVSAAISSGLGLQVEDTALATFTYPGGLIAEVATSWCLAAADASIEVYGTEGTILVSGVDLASRPTREKGFIRIFRRTPEGGEWRDSDTVPAFKTGVFHDRVAWAFVDALAAGDPMPVSLRDGLYASAMIEAAYRAAETGCTQTILYPECVS